MCSSVSPCRALWLASLASIPTSHCLIVNSTSSFGVNGVIFLFPLVSFRKCFRRHLRAQSFFKAYGIFTKLPPSISAEHFWASCASYPRIDSWADILSHFISRTISHTHLWDQPDNHVHMCRLIRILRGGEGVKLECNMHSSGRLGRPLLR